MKKFGLLLVVATLVLFSAATTQAGLMSLFTFDDSTSQTTLAVNAVNSAMNGTGVALGSAAGKIGGAITCVGDGTFLGTGHIDLPGASAPSGAGPAGSFSVWAKGNLSGGDYQLLSLTGGGAAIWVDTANGKFDTYQQDHAMALDIWRWNRCGS